MPLLKILSQQRPLFDSARLKGLGVIISAVIVALAIFALRHALKNVDYEEIFAVVERTRPEMIALALLFVIISYASLTIYASRQKARSPILIPSEPESSTPAN